MQTIASMANRLDMNSDEALATLRRLNIDIKDDQTPLSDKQCDILIAVDEDPSVMDVYLKEISKKEEEARKRTERLQTAAKKAAATRKAAAKKKPAPAKKAPAKKKPKQEEAGEETEPLPEDGQEILEDATEEDVESEEIAPQEVTPIEVKKPDTATPPPVAEILSDEAEPFERKPLVRSPKKDDSAPDGADRPIGGILGGMRDQEGTRSAQPDPEVVAEVIRKAQERARQKQTKNARVEVKGVGGGGEYMEPAPGSSTAGSGKNAKKTGKTARKKQKRKERVRVLEDTLRRDAAEKVREYQSGGMLGGGPKKKRKKRMKEDGEEFMQEEIIRGGLVELEEAMTLEQIAGAMEVSVNELILELMEDNILAHKNQILDLELVRRLAAKFNFEVKTVIPEEEDIMREEPDDPADMVFRPPVITVMGHVDHGKTSLLDVVRSTNVVAGEAGGITQHIAAYDVSLPSGRIVFLDTPGHEAFTQMRSRGAQVTDVVVLVVAADDGIKPQTVEAIDHAKAAGVPIVVAVNKCDKAEAKPDQVRQELTKYELVAEEWGGKTQMVNISAKTRTGVDSLLELLVLESEMLELKANPNKKARGTVIESEISLGQGPVAWVLVQTGTLKVGDVFIAGETYGRVRSMTNSAGKQVTSVGPSTPVVVTGFNHPSDAGDQFVVVLDERIARTVAQKRATLKKHKMGAKVKHMTLEDFHSRMLAGDQKQLNIIIKADVQGSVDVLQTSCAKVGNEEVRVNIVHSGVGGVNESDILLASASDAVIVAFQVAANAKVQKLAEQEGVEIRGYRVIYEAIADLHSALEGLLTPDKKEVVIGHAEIRQVFRSSALGSIAGSYQLDGVTERGGRIRLIRDGLVVHEGSIHTIRRQKDDVKSIAAGFECGIKIDNYNDIHEGDVIESYKIESVAKTLN